MNIDALVKSGGIAHRAIGDPMTCATTSIARLRRGARSWPAERPPPPDCPPGLESGMNRRWVYRDTSASPEFTWDWHADLGGRHD